MRALIIRVLLSTKPYFHPRVFTFLIRVFWPLLSERDGYLPVRYRGLEIRVDLREAAEQEIFLHRYDPPLCALVEKICRPGDNVVDVGANVGVISATAANAVGPEGQVVAIEPNPKLARRLRGLGNRNPLENIQNSNSVIYTMINGRLYDTETMHEIGNYDNPRGAFYWERDDYAPAFEWHGETHTGCTCEIERLIVTFNRKCSECLGSPNG